MISLPTQKDACRICDHTQPFTFAEWNYYFGRRWSPEDDDLFNHKNYSRSAQFVSEKWAYIYRNVRGTISLHRELWIDEHRKIHGTPPNRCTKPVEERGDTKAKESDATQYNLDYFDHRGVRVDGYYVLYSEYRLPLAALVALETATVKVPGCTTSVFAIHALLRSCLRWTRRAPSTRGIYEHERCEEDPEVRPVETFLKIGGIRSVVGFDLLRIALLLSDEYRKELHTFQRRFIKPDKQHATEFHRESLARTIHSLVSDSQELADRVKEDLRWSDLEKYIEKRSSDRKRLVRRYERAAARVCQVLDNPIYEILRSAHRFDEDNPDVEHVAKAAYFAQYYAGTLFELTFSAAGAAYVTKQVDEFLKGKSDWTKQWGGTGDHYLKTYVFPDDTSTTQVFKTTRLVSKSIISLFTNFVGALLAKRRTTTAKDVAKHLEFLFRGGKGFKIGDIFYEDILGIKVAHVKIGAETWTRGPGGKQFKRIETSIPLLEKGDLEALTKYEQQALDAKRLTKKTRMAAIVFDTVNVCLALNALREKLSNDIAMDWGREALDASAHTLNLTKTVIEQTCGDALSKSAMTKLSAVSIVTGAYFICADLYDADKASDLHDYDVAYANIGAAVGEALVIVGILITLKATASGAAAGPAGAIVGLIGGLIAAVGYILAGWMKDTPIETMMKHSEWGTAAFQQPDDHLIYTWHYPWSFAQWKNHPERQMAALFNLVGQFSVESFKPDVEHNILQPSSTPANPFYPVIVRLTQLFDDTRLVARVHGELEHPNGKSIILSSQPVPMESKRLLKLVHWSSGEGQPFVALTYPEHIKKSVRNAYKEGYAVKSMSMSVSVELRHGQSVGHASAKLYADGEIADYNRRVSTAGSHNPHF